MSYKLPNPSIFQILTRASQDLTQANLLPCLIGPLNQVETDTLIQLTYPVTNSTVAYPNQKVGSVMDTSSVSIKVTNAVISLNTLPAGDNTGSSMVTAGDKTITKTGAFANAEPGDKIIFSIAPASVFTIDTVTSSDAVEVLETPAFSISASGTFTLRRSVGEVAAEITATYTNSDFTITALEYDGYTIVSGSSYLSYVALRKDLTGFYEITNLDQLRIDMETDIKNPLGYYLGIIMAGANGGKKILAYILGDNTNDAYLASLSDLGIRKDAYFLIPMSTNSTVLNAFAAHVTAMSQPDSSYFRAAILNATLTTETTVTSGIYTKPA